MWMQVIVVIIVIVVILMYFASYSNFSKFYKFKLVFTFDSFAHFQQFCTDISRNSKVRYVIVIMTVHIGWWVLNWFFEFILFCILIFSIWCEQFGFS